MSKKATFLKVELTFNREAERFLHFPVRSTIRLSIWGKGCSHSTPSEIVSEKPFELEQPCIADLCFYQDGQYLDIDISPGAVFEFRMNETVYGTAMVVAG